MEFGKRLIAIYVAYFEEKVPVEIVYNVAFCVASFKHKLLVIQGRKRKDAKGKWVQPFSDTVRHIIFQNIEILLGPQYAYFIWYTFSDPWGFQFNEKNDYANIIIINLDRCDTKKTYNCMMIHVFVFQERFSYLTLSSFSSSASLCFWLKFPSVNLPAKAP